MAECGEKTARHFEPPPNCPVFTPTIEEFADPLAYIAKIRPRAEPYGICKVRPPPGWEPPFCVNFETLKFTPRVQRINELEAHTRIKINFLDRLAKFWELQGSVLQVPTVERKTLDLYKFFEMVRSKGGYEAVETAHLWDHFARTLVGDKVAGEEVKAHYKRILYPFELFEDGKCLNHLKLKNPHRGRKRRVQTNVNLLFDPVSGRFQQDVSEVHHELCGKNPSVAGVDSSHVVRYARYVHDNLKSICSIARERYEERRKLPASFPSVSAASDQSSLLQEDPRKVKPLYDDKGRLIGSGVDVCDCLDVSCPGCFFPCANCDSNMCGISCRVGRSWQHGLRVEDGGDEVLYFDRATAQNHFLSLD